MRGASWTVAGIGASNRGALQPHDLLGRFRRCIRRAADSNPVRSRAPRSYSDPSAASNTTWSTPRYCIATAHTAEGSIRACMRCAVRTGILRVLAESHTAMLSAGGRMNCPWPYPVRACVRAGVNACVYTGNIHTGNGPIPPTQISHTFLRCVQAVGFGRL